MQSVLQGLRFRWSNAGWCYSEVLLGPGDRTHSPEGPASTSGPSREGTAVCGPGNTLNQQDVGASGVALGWGRQVLTQGLLSCDLGLPMQMSPAHQVGHPAPAHAGRRCAQDPARTTHARCWTLPANCRLPSRGPACWWGTALRTTSAHPHLGPHLPTRAAETDVPTNNPITFRRRGEKKRLRECPWVHETRIFKVPFYFQNILSL